MLAISVNTASPASANPVAELHSRRRQLLSPIGHVIDTGQGRKLHDTLYFLAPCLKSDAHRRVHVSCALVLWPCDWFLSRHHRILCSVVRGVSYWFLIVMFLSPFLALVSEAMPLDRLERRRRGEGIFHLRVGYA